MTFGGWPIMNDVGVTAAIAAWQASRGSEHQRRLQSVADEVRRAVVPSLSAQGAVRLRLLELPDAVETVQLEALLRAVSSGLGALVPQSRSNERIARIEDQGADYRSPHTRGHHTSAELSFHSDRCDLNLLLYVRTAAEGGELSVVSYADAASALQEQDRPSLERLFRDFPFDARDDRIFEDQPWYERPILWHHGTGARGHYIRRFITDSQRHADCPRLTLDDSRALDAFDGAIESIRPARTHKPVPGELLVMDSYRVMHARRGFVNDPAGPGRLAIRTWVAPFASEELPSSLLPLCGSVAAGSFRGGAGSGREYLSSLGRRATEVAREWT